MSKVNYFKIQGETKLIFNLIRGMRNDAKVSQKRIAAALGMSQQGYSDIEKKKSMTLEQFLTVCDEIDADPAEIIRIATGGRAHG